MDNQLKSLLANHQQLAFPQLPKSSENVKLADWLTDLAEIDGYYVGLAVSALAGEETKKIRRSNTLLQLGKRLEELNKSNPIGKKLFQHCQNYLSSLESLSGSLDSHELR